MKSWVRVPLTSPLIEAERYEAEVALTLDQQQYRFPSGPFCFLDLAADFARALHLLLRGLHDQVARAYPFCSRGTVFGDIDDDNPLRIVCEREFILQVRRDPRQGQAQGLDHPGVARSDFLGGCLSVR